MATPADALARLPEVLDRMEISYCIGGSVASSAHGIPRMTNDVDLVVELTPDRIGEFAASLQGEFYADAALIRESFALGRAANLIHYATAYKVDLFPRRNDDYSRMEFGRRTRTVMFREIHSLTGAPVECAVASAEDTILRKLEWYRRGGETSERQWNDLRTIRKAQGAQLDRAYLRKWAPDLKVADLLERLLGE